MALSTSRERHAHERILEALLIEMLCSVGVEDLANAAAAVEVHPLVDPDGETETQIAGTLTFEDACVLTGDRGLVVTLTDGSEFQLTIVRSRNPRAEG